MLNKITYLLTYLNWLVCLWCGRSDDEVGILDERLRSGPTGGVVEGRPEDLSAYTVTIVQIANDQSSDERLEDWRRDKVTDAA